MSVLLGLSRLLVGKWQENRPSGLYSGFIDDNMVYQIKFDGTILEYRLHGIFRPLASVIGIQTTFCIPGNILLGVRRRRFLGLHVVKIHKGCVSVARKRVDVKQMSCLLLFPRGNQTYDHLQKAIKVNLVMAIEGQNIGLPFLDKREAKSFYARLKSENGQ